MPYGARTGRCLEAHITIGDLGEFGVIARITATLPPARQAVVGVGDDAAVVRTPDGRVVATTDLLLEGRHFRREWSGPGDVGHKAAARGLADVAAMGAVPAALLVAFAAPGDLDVRWAEEFMSGLAAECARGGAVVVGGDLAAAETITIAVTALGDLHGRPPVTRGGAQPGDMVAVAGSLGHSAAGLALLRQRLSEPSALVAAHRRPHPPYDAGPEAALLGATAMIDVSDGLLADLGHLAEASAVLVDLGTHLLPVSALLSDAEAVLITAAAGGASSPGEPCPADTGQDGGRGRALDWVLTGGEDHALAATFPPGTELPGRWVTIGQVRAVSEEPAHPGERHAGAGEVARGEVLVDGKRRFGTAGWDHFR